MSDESTARNNEDALRRSIEGLNRRDFNAAISVWASNAVWDGSPSGGFVHDGVEAIRKLWEELLAPYEDFETAIEEAHDLNSKVAFMVFVSRGRPRGSNALVDGRFAVVLTWADGLLQRGTICLDIDEGRAAAERLAQERG